MCEQPIESYASGRFVVKIYNDFDPDLSYLGTFTNHPNWHTGKQFRIYDRKMTGHHNYNECLYWQSSYDILEGQAWYRSHGYSKHDSYTIPLQQDKANHERAESYGKDWGMIGICITYNDVTLASCWGIESDSDYYDIVLELLSEAEYEYLKNYTTNRKSQHVGYCHKRKTT